MALHTQLNVKNTKFHGIFHVFGDWNMATVLPAKSDSDVIFVYKVFRDL